MRVLARVTAVFVELDVSLATRAGANGDDAVDGETARVFRMAGGSVHSPSDV